MTSHVWGRRGAGGINWIVKTTHTLSAEKEATLWASSSHSVPGVWMWSAAAAFYGTCVNDHWGTTLWQLQLLPSHSCHSNSHSHRVQEQPKPHRWTAWDLLTGGQIESAYSLNFPIYGPVLSHRRRLIHFQTINCGSCMWCWWIAEIVEWWSGC